MNRLGNILVLFGLVFLSSQAEGAPITGAAGTWSNVDQNGPTSVFSYIGGNLSAVSPPQPASDGFGTLPAGAYSLSNLTIDLTPYQTDNTLGNVTVNPVFTVTGTPGSGVDNGNTAVFNLVGQATLDEGGMADALWFVLELASSNITQIDFGSVGDQFLYVGSLNTSTFTTGNPGSADISLGVSNASFSLVRLVIPEPTTMALWGLGAAGFALVARRRRRSRTA